MNNNFKITGKNLSVISVHIMKKGYYLERLSFNNAWFKDRKEAEIKGKTLIDKNVKVVLREIGEVAKTWPYNSKLYFYEGGKGKGANLNIKVFYADKYVQISNVFDEKSIPPNCMYIVPDVDKNGKIETVKIENDNDNDDNIRLTAKAIHLRLSDPEGGFVIYHPKEKNLQNFERIVQGMREAPEEGYEKQKEISLNKNDLMHTRYIFFYFKVGGKYGKGRIRNIDTDFDDGEIKLSVYMHFNPTGSRNVTTAGASF